MSSRPDIGPELRISWDAFWDLEGDRAIGGMGGVGPLPYAARSAWLRDHGITGEVAQWYHDRWRRMDGVYVAHYNRPKGEKDGAQGNADAGARRG